MPNISKSSNSLSSRSLIITTGEKVIIPPEFAIRSIIINHPDVEVYISNDYKGNVLFLENATLIVEDGVTVEGNILTNNNCGDITFNGSANITGNIGSAENALQIIQLYCPSDVCIRGEIFAEVICNNLVDIDNDFMDANIYDDDMVMIDAFIINDEGEGSLELDESLTMREALGIDNSEESEEGSAVGAVGENDFSFG